MAPRHRGRRVVPTAGAYRPELPLAFAVLQRQRRSPVPRLLARGTVLQPVVSDVDEEPDAHLHRRPRVVHAVRGEIDATAPSTRGATGFLAHLERDSAAPRLLAMPVIGYLDNGSLETRMSRRFIEFVRDRIRRGPEPRRRIPLGGVSFGAPDPRDRTEEASVVSVTSAAD